jgi:hypothetical protein
MMQTIIYRHFKDLASLGDYLFVAREQYRIVSLVTRDIPDQGLGFKLEALIVFETREDR